MKKQKKNNSKSNQGIIVWFISLVVLPAFVLFVYKFSNFNKPIPDVVELPQEIKESIRNTKPQKSLKVPILLYHYVEYVKDPGDTIRKSLNIMPNIFDQQVKTLKDEGFTFMTTKELADVLDDQVSLPVKPVILTFDDGYRDFYTDVFPVLKKYQAKAVVYVVPNFLDKPNNLTTWMLSEIVQSGLVEIGAHTMNHSVLTGLPLQDVKYEVEESKNYLEKILRMEIVSFAYPNGSFDNQVIDVVHKAGFKSAVSTISGIFAQDINRFFLYRIRPGVKVGLSLIDLFGSNKTVVQHNGWSTSAKAEPLKTDNFLPQKGLQLGYQAQ